MPLRTGAPYMAGLNDDRALYMAGERIRDVTRHPALAGSVRSIAEHYDRFHAPALQVDYTYPSPADGKPVSNSFLPADIPARERTQLMKLACDVLASEFGGHLEIYEIFFAGDPFLGRQLHDLTPRRTEYEAWVDRLLAESAPRQGAPGPALTVSPTHLSAPTHR